MADACFAVAGLLGAAAFLLFILAAMLDSRAEEKERERSSWAIIDHEFIEYETDSSRRK